MTQLDWIIVAFAGVFALLGYRQGLIVGSLSLIGFIVGAYAGVRIAPLVLSRGGTSSYAPVLDWSAGLRAARCWRACSSGSPGACAGRS